MKEITEQIVSLKKSFEEAPAQGKTKEEKEAFKAKMNELVKKSLEIRQKIDVSHVEIANINQEILKTVGQVTQEVTKMKFICNKMKFVFSLNIRKGRKEETE